MPSPLAPIIRAVGRRPFGRTVAFWYEAMLAAAVADAIAPLFAEVARGRVLDVGCGGGEITRRLGGFGVDASFAQAQRARGVCATADRLPFADASFDAVVSSCSIKHWPDMAAGIAECRRVLRPGGTLAVLEMERTSTSADVAAYVATTRIPRVLRRAYAIVEHRAVLPGALTADELGALVGAPARKLDGLPFAVAVARV